MLLYVPFLNLSFIVFSNIISDLTREIAEIEQINTRLSPETKKVFLSLSEDEKRDFYLQILKRKQPKLEEYANKWLSTTNIIKEIVRQVFLIKEEERITQWKPMKKYKSLLMNYFHTLPPINFNLLRTYCYLV